MRSDLLFRNLLLTFICVTIIFGSTDTFAQEESAPEDSSVTGDIVVNSITFCENVEDRTPVSPGETFTADNERVYCFTEVNCKLEEAHIQHLWYLNEVLMSTIDLKIGKSNNWRTWSYKSLFPEAVGKWEVVVKVLDGEILKMGQFEVK